MRCDYFLDGRCHSCELMGEPYGEQLAAKDAWVRGALAGVPGLGVVPWEEPCASLESGFRNKAKFVVGGSVAAPTLGILDRAGRGVDLRECGLYSAGIIAAAPTLAAFISRAGLVPYDVPAARGELKYLLLTESPGGEFLLRLVLRSEDQLPAVRRELPWLLDQVPGLRVVSVNLQPVHKAIIEGDEEFVLTEQASVPFELNGVRLHLGPRAFFQTNTEIAARLYSTARAWLADIEGPILDLYCGVGGFALHLAAPDREIHGIETSAEAVAAAQRSAAEMGLAPGQGWAGQRSAGQGAAGTVTFRVGDATEIVTATGTVVVNPPRRGIGPLAEQLENSPVATVLYSSCDPATLARDLGKMPSFRPIRAQLFDMFPQTMHAETLVLLQRG